MGRFGGPLVAGCLFLAAVLPAGAQLTCNLTQITSSPFGTHSLGPSINPAGTRIAFASSANLSGGNGDGGFEIFLWDASTGFTQVTDIDSPGGLPLAINGAGNRIAFTSTVDPLGGNGDHNAEIFLWDASTGLTQITNTTGVDNISPDIDDAGDRITFSAYDQPLSAGGNSEIYLWDATTGLAQITNTTAEWENIFPSINASGNRIAFQSRSLSLTPGNPDRNFEILLWDSSTGITPVTSTDGDNAFPSINPAGNRIAFGANFQILHADVVPASEIHLWDVSAGFTRITQTTSSFYSDSILPAINAAGNRIAFVSNANLLGNGEGNYDLFLWDAAAGLTQITNTTINDHGRSSINATGDRLAFSSTANLVGTNSDGSREVFLAACGPLVLEGSVPAVSPLGLAALAALLGLAAAWTLRRRRESV